MARLGSSLTSLSLGLLLFVHAVACSTTTSSPGRGQGGSTAGSAGQLSEGSGRGGRTTTEAGAPSQGGHTNEAGNTAEGGDTGEAGAPSQGGDTGEAGAPSQGGDSGEAGAGGTAGVAGETGTGGTDNCPSTHVCIPETPDGWEGPVIVAEGSSAPASCPASTYPFVAFRGGRDLSADGECSCTCGAPTAASCGTSYAWMGYSDEECLAADPDRGGSGLAEPTISDCISTATEIDGIYGYGFSLTPPDVTCGEGSIDALPPPEFGTEFLSCSGAAPGGTCAESDQTCVRRPPSGFETKLCIYQLGEQTCPAGYVTEPTVYEGFAEGRDCGSACTCSATEGECTTTLRVYDGSDDACNATLETHSITSDAPSCFAPFDNISYSNVSLDTPSYVAGSATCTADATTWSPSGAPRLTDPVTVCCLDLAE